MKLLERVVCLCLVLLITGCGGPQTPQEVSQAYWQAMLTHDASEAADHSTLVDEASFEGYSGNGEATDISWGRVVIDGDKAQVETVLHLQQDGQSRERKTMTYLVKREGDWLVDYSRTQEALNQRPLFENLVNELQGLGEKLSRRFSEESDKTASELEALARELEREAVAANERLNRLVEQYSEQLEKRLEDLSESLREGLENNPQAPPEDKRALKQAAQDVDRQREALDENPDLKAVADSGRLVAETRMTLGQLESEFDDFQAQWEKRLKDIEKELADFIQSLQ